MSAVSFSDEQQRVVALPGAEDGSLLAALPLPAFCKDLNNRFTGCNQAFADLFGMARAAVVGLEPTDLMPDTVAEICRIADGELYRDGGTVVRQVRIPVADSSQHDVVIRKQLRLDVAGRPVGLVGVLIDNTPQLEQARALSEARETAERANRAKTQFVANISHELRTPLNAVIGFAEILEGEYFGPHGAPQYKEYSGEIREGARHLLALINQILDLSRIESGQYELLEKELDLGDVITRTARLLRTRIAEREHVLSLDLEPVPPVLAEQRALQQILVNLIDNAAKFSAPGTRIDVSLRIDDSGAPTITVRDSGPGIARHELERVVEPFFRGHQAMAEQLPGTGLGLAIVRDLVELHGGSLSVASEENVGTLVRVRLRPESVLSGGSAVMPWHITG